MLVVLQAVTNPKNTVFATKRLIGRKFTDPLVKKEMQASAARRMYPFVAAVRCIFVGSYTTCIRSRLLSCVCTDVGTLCHGAYRHVNQVVSVWCMETDC